MNSVRAHGSAAWTARGPLGVLARAYRRVDASVSRRQHPARAIQIRTLLDTFFVCAIATILIIRLQLWATNYPKLGGGKLHIAHLLWGGVGMLVAIVLLLGFLDAGRRQASAVLGGIGFGFFIDEIGKFVTSDNDYFFKPAAGMIYIIFIVLFLTIRSLGWRHRWTREECLTNATMLLANAAYRPLRVSERRLVGSLLGHCDQTNPLVAPLRALFAQLESTPPPPPGRLSRLGARFRSWYFRVAEQPRFAATLVIVFIAVATLTVAQVALDARRIFNGTEPVHVIGVAGLASSLIAAGLIWTGVFALRTSRLTAYRWFDHALLVQVFVTEVFEFLQDQFGAVFGLLLNLALLAALRTMIRAELHGKLPIDDPLDPVAPGTARVTEGMPG